jgi:hypothetical protein
VALALVSLVLTSCAGLQAVSFCIRGEFDPAWWIPNLFLLLHPLYFVPGSPPNAVSPRIPRHLFTGVCAPRGR